MKWFATIATALLACCTGAWAAGAATLTMQTNNVNDPVNHPYSQNAYVGCGSNNYCVITFPSTTASETLVQHVSCQIELTSTGGTTSAFVENVTSGDANFLPVTNYASGSYNQVADENTYLFAKSGDVLEIYFYASGSPPYSLYCSISGYHN